MSWPKTVSRLPTGITEDAVRELAFPLGMVDVKACAFSEVDSEVGSEVGSALRLVIRKENR
jgi:hypothetical protein